MASPGKRQTHVSAALFALLAVLFAAACIFFVYYSVRLVWVNVTDSDVPRHRQSGMYIGAAAFPRASMAFGYLTLRCARAVVRAARAREAQ
jgi:hypothetical protein